MISSVSAWRRGCRAIGSSFGQRADLALGHLLHEPRQPLHLLAVEGGQHQLPLAEVGPFVEQDHRVHSEDRLEHARALARVQHLGRRREDLAQMLGLRVDARTAASGACAS